MSSEADSDTQVNGIAGLRARRAERIRRQPPPPRHPKPKPAVSDAHAGGDDPVQQSTGNGPTATRDTADEISHEVAPESSRLDRPAEATNHETDMPAPARPPKQSSAARSTSRSSKRYSRSALPDLGVDIDDPGATVVSPTVLSIAGPIMRRFEKARTQAASHTSLVLDALRAHAQALPALVADSRPAAPKDDLFPWRSKPGAPRTSRPEPLRIRPTVGELQVIDGLVNWVNTELPHYGPGGAKASRSEVVAAALNAYLPDA